MWYIIYIYMIYEIWYMINYIPYATSLFNQFFLIPRCFWWQISLPPRGSTESPLRIEQLANGTGKEVKLICLKGLRQVGHDLKPESVKSTAKRLDGPGLNHWGFPTIRPAIKPWNVWGGWYVREGLVDFRHKLMLQKSEWINTWHPVNSGINLPFPQLVTLHQQYPQIPTSSLWKIYIGETSMIPYRYSRLCQSLWNFLWWLKDVIKCFWVPKENWFVSAAGF